MTTCVVCDFGHPFFFKTVFIYKRGYGTNSAGKRIKQWIYMQALTGTVIHYGASASFSQVRGAPLCPSNVANVQLRQHLLPSFNLYLPFSKHFFSSTGQITTTRPKSTMA